MGAPVVLFAFAATLLSIPSTVAASGRLGPPDAEQGHELRALASDRLSTALPPSFSVLTTFDHCVLEESHGACWCWRAFTARRTAAGWHSALWQELT